MRGLFAFAFLAFSSATAVCGELHRDAARQFHFAIPAGWVALSPAELKEINDNFARVAPGKNELRCFAGYRLRSRTIDDSPLFILQDMEHSGGVMYEGMEKELKAIAGKPVLAQYDRIPDDIRRLAVNEVALDRARNRFAMTCADPVNKVRGLSMGHIGARRVIIVHSYIDERDLDKHQPAIRAVSDSFEFDSAAAYNPAAAEEAARRESPGQAYHRAVLRYGILGGIGFLFYSFVRRFFVSKKPAI